MKYVKNNFLRGRRDQDVAEVNRELGRWTLEIASTRVHAFSKSAGAMTESLRDVRFPTPAGPSNSTLWASRRNCTSLER